MPKVRKAIAELKTEIGNWGRERRLSYLETRFKEVHEEIKEIYDSYEHLTKVNTPYMAKHIVTISLPGLEKELNKIQSEMNYLKSALNGKPNNNSLTPEMIEIAKQHPFENLVDIKKGKALCPFHDDHNPSMSIKNNRYRCWACGESGDLIGFVMKREGMTFPEAVKCLI